MSILISVRTAGRLDVEERRRKEGVGCKTCAWRMAAQRAPRNSWGSEELAGLSFQS